MLRLFADRLTYPLVADLFDACAKVPGYWVPKSQIDGDGDPNQLRNELGAMTKLIYKLFSRDRGWPIEYRKVRGRYEYRMDHDTAKAWCEIRGLA